MNGHATVPPLSGTSPSPFSDLVTKIGPKGMCLENVWIVFYFISPKHLFIKHENSISRPQGNITHLSAVCWCCLNIFVYFYYYFNLFDKFVYVFIQNLNSVHKEISWFIFYINLILLHRITVIIKYSHLYSYFLMNKSKTNTKELVRYRICWHLERAICRFSYSCYFSCALVGVLIYHRWQRWPTGGSRVLWQSADFFIFSLMSGTVEIIVYL